MELNITEGQSEVVVKDEWGAKIRVRPQQMKYMKFKVVNGDTSMEWNITGLKFSPDGKLEIRLVDGSTKVIEEYDSFKTSLVIKAKLRYL